MEKFSSVQLDWQCWHWMVEFIDESGIGSSWLPCTAGHKTSFVIVQCIWCTDGNAWISFVTNDALLDC